MKSVQKATVSPFMAIAFVVVSATGGLLFFHIKNGVIITLHEWFGWAFIVVGCVHLFLNRKPFVSYMTMRKGLLSLLIVLCLALAIGAIGAHRKGGKHKPDRAPHFLDQRGSSDGAMQTPSRNPSL